MTRNFHLSGNDASSHPSVAQGFLFFTMGANFTPGVTHRSPPGVMSPGNIQTGLIPITFGQPFPIRAGLETRIEGGGSDTPGPIDAGIFYSDTAAFTHVQVFDAAGAPLPSFTILSDSGTDYANIIPVTEQVPAPGTLLLLGSGLLGSAGRLIWRARRRTPGVEG